MSQFFCVFPLGQKSWRCRPRKAVGTQKRTGINTKAGRNIRGNGVYLSDDPETMDGFDRYFRISTSKLDTTRLFIVDNRQLDFILAYINTKMASEYTQRYIKSYIKYRDFWIIGAYIRNYIHLNFYILDK